MHVYKMYECVIKPGLRRARGGIQGAPCLTFFFFFTAPGPMVIKPLKNSPEKSLLAPREHIPHPNSEGFPSAAAHVFGKEVSGFSPSHEWCCQHHGAPCQAVTLRFATCFMMHSKPSSYTQ